MNDTFSFDWKITIRKINKTQKWILIAHSKLAITACGQHLDLNYACEQFFHFKPFDSKNVKQKQNKKQIVN